MSTESKELRLASLTLLLPLYIAVVFGANYFGALHAPKPHGVKVAIVGAPSSTSRIAHQLSTRSRGGFDVLRLTSISQARELVGARRLAGAYLPGQRPTPVVVVATAASASLATFVEATFRELAAAQNRPVVVDDLKPLPANNASGSPNFFFIVISLGALYAFAVALITRLLQLGLGGFGTLIGSLVLIFLNVPSSGRSVAAPLLPGFWRSLSHFWIGAAALDANRSALYFGGSGVADDVLTMLAWVAAWACLPAVPIHVRSTRRACGSLVSRTITTSSRRGPQTSTPVAVDGSAETGH